MEIEQVLSELRRHEDDMVAMRRDIHMHPETSYEEFRTSKIVQDRLTEWGIPFEAGLAGTGVVASIRGTRPGNRSLGLRADMDALNMTETNTFAHKSTIPGKFHGCGHDGHTTMLLYAAKYMHENPDFAGTVHCIFQPAEEGGAGGKRMIDEGLFDRHPCDSVYSMHNKPGLPVGQFVTRVGPQLACADQWEVTFNGTGGHGGSPEKGTDIMLPLAHFILGLQTIMTRDMSPLDTAVVSIGMINAGSTHNVIPAELKVVGTARCHRPEVRDTIERRIAEIASAAASLHGCTASLAYDRGYPPLINTADETARAVAAAEAVTGWVDGDNPPINAADDFAYYLIERPGCNVMLGMGEGLPQNHRPDYDFNDEILTLGAAYWVSIVDQELNQSQVQAAA